VVPPICLIPRRSVHTHVLGMESLTRPSSVDSPYLEVSSLRMDVTESWRGLDSILIRGGVRNSSLVGVGATRIGLIL